MHRSSSTSPWPQSSLPPSSASHWWKETKRVKFGACTEHEQPSIPIDATSVTTPVDMLPVAPVCEQMLQATSAGTSGILKESARIQEPSYVQALRDVLSWRNLSTFLSLDSRWQAIYGILFSLDPYPQGGLQNIRMAYEYIFRGSRLDINVDILRYCVLELGIQDLDELQKFAPIIQHWNLNILQYFIQEVHIPVKHILRLAPMILRWRLDDIQRLVAQWHRDAQSLVAHMQSVLP